MDKYISNHEPVCWFLKWTSVVFCPKCGCGQRGRDAQVTDPCPDCGYNGVGFTVQTARLVPDRTWWKPWTWFRYKTEVQTSD